MKTTPSMLPPLFFAVSALGFCCAFGEDNAPAAPAVGGESQQNETNEGAVSSTTGTVFSLEADALSLTTEKSAIPLVFVITTATALVDEEDKEVAKDLVRKGIAATVFYTTLGEKLLATKVIFTREDLTGGGPADPATAGRKRAALKETKVMKDETVRARAIAAEGNGTLMGFEQILTVRAPGDTSVTQYTINNSTLYVDSAGNPVPPHAVRTGAGLHVQFVEDAGRKIATRVTVRTMPAWARDGLIAAESGTALTPGSDAQNTTRNRGTTGTTSSGTTSATDLSDAFIYPPILSLPSDQPNVGIVPNVPEPGANANGNQVNPGQANTTPPANNNNTQPGTTNNNNQPGTTKPNNNRPNPGTTQPGNRTNPSTPSQPRSNSPYTPSQPSTPPAAPGAR